MIQCCDFCETARVAERVVKMLEALPTIGEPLYDDIVIETLETAQHIVDIFRHEHEHEGGVTSYVEEFRERVLAASEDEITIDSEWVFWPTWNRGHYTAEALRVIADELDRRNEELHDDD